MRIRGFLWFTAAMCSLTCGAAPVGYTYRILAPQKVTETKSGAINDGNLKTSAYWKGPQGVVVCELPAATEIAEVVVTVKKTTNWYLMHEVEVAVDGDGSGEYDRPKSVPVNISGYNGKPPVIDASCTNMTYRIPLGSKAVKVKVVVKTRAWGAISEIVLDDGKGDGKGNLNLNLNPNPKLNLNSQSSDIAAARAALPGNLTKVANKQFEMLVTPLGGRVLSLRSKFLDAELTNVKADAGTFSEFDWSRRGNKWFYLKKPFVLKPFSGDGFCGLEARGNAQGGGTDRGTETRQRTGAGAQTVRGAEERADPCAYRGEPQEEGDRSNGEQTDRNGGTKGKRADKVNDKDGRDDMIEQRE